jgi:DNA-binding NtrC family response regulator
MVRFAVVSGGGDRTKADPRVGALRVHEATLERAATPVVRVRIEGTAPVVVGSGESCDLRIADDETVSRVHARFMLTEGGLLVVDEGSRNGTWIGQVRVQRATITQDTQIRVGNTALSLRIDEQAKDLPLSRRTRMGEAIGYSPEMRHLFSLLERIAGTDVTVLLEGESGVGKEVLTRALHSFSTRAKAPFVTVDCGAIPKDLIESELFGHERGSFTGATQARIGLFEQADGGTLFLDEIGELPLELQPKLLRALEAREIRAVGSNAVRLVDVRVIAATNRSLADEVRRLSVARVRVPPLRDRASDVDVLATAFYREVVKNDAASLPPDVLELLRSYRWPGNVRELRNVVSRYALLGFSGRALFDEQVPGAAHSAAAAPAGVPDWQGRPYHEARQQVLDRFEVEFTRDAIARAHGVMLRAAELSGMARSSFYRLVEKHGVRDVREPDPER